MPKGVFGSCVEKVAPRIMQYKIINFYQTKLYPNKTIYIMYHYVTPPYSFVRFLAYFKILTAVFTSTIDAGCT